MTELQLFKFITENHVEWHEYENEDVGTKDVMIMPSFGQLEELNEILPSCIFDDGGIPATLKDGYICVWMRNICDYSGIEMENVFEGFKSE